MEETAGEKLQQRQGSSTPSTPAHGPSMSCVCKLASSLLLEPPADGAGSRQPFLLVKLRTYCCQPLLQELDMYDVSLCNPLSINQVLFILATVMQLFACFGNPLHAIKAAFGKGHLQFLS